MLISILRSAVNSSNKGITEGRIEGTLYVLAVINSSYIKGYIEGGGGRIVGKLYPLLEIYR